MATVYTTLDDLVDREIVPALGDFADEINLGAVAEKLRDIGLIVYDDSRAGFCLVTDESGSTPILWEIVALS